MQRTSRRIWLGVGGVAAAICLALAPAMMRVWSCVGAYSAGEHAPSEIVSVHETGVSVLVRGEGAAAGEARSCFVPGGDLPNEALEVGDSLEVVINARFSERCTTADTLDAAEAGLTAIVAMLVVVLLALVLIGLKLQRDLCKTPPLTTHLDVGGTAVACPRCGKQMETGYLPLVAGVHWRDAEEPLGMPHALSGLPGTVGWRGRPCVQSARCEPCELLLFRYGSSPDRAGSEAAS